MPNPELVRLARTPRPSTIPEVVARLRVIEASLPAEHGVACFNRLYRWTTENVHRAVEGGRFEDPAAMVALDVRFADLYFDAVDAWALGGPLPPAWAPLLERGIDPDIAPLRFALAGMHAHINRDLAVAIAVLDDEPHDDSARFRDFELVNRVLDETSDAVRHRLLPPTLQRIDAHLHEVDDIAILGSIALARRAAWEAGQVLWNVRERRWAWDLAVGCLDTAVGASATVLLFDPGLHVGSSYAPAMRTALVHA